MRNLLLLPLTLFCLATPVIAQDINYNQISLSVTASEEVDNDVMNAQLIVQENGAQPSLLTQRVNARMTKVLAIVERSADINAQTNHYNTQPRYKSGKIFEWQVTQSINLSSSNIEQLTTLLAKLNDLAHIQSMTFSVSDSLRDQTKHALTKTAIKQFRDKAQVITEQFDKTTYQLVHASVDTNSNHYRPKHMMMERMAVADVVSAPAVSAGTNKITVTVNGSIELSD